jgi:prolyl-tRNA synthetase
MRYSRLFSKASKTAPHDTDSVNAKLLSQAGFVRQEMAGVYSWLPLGLRVLRKVEEIVREEMNGLGAQEILMPALAPKEYWETTGRWNTVDILFKIKSQTGKEYALGASHEEVVTPLVKSFLSSYKDLPIAVYQIQTKFRDELRAKSGVLRGREFSMKDMYSFHETQEDLEAFYEKAKEAYLRVYERCGVPARAVQASGGIFTEKPSHEFQILTDAGEDQLLVCERCDFAQNSEVSSLKEGDACPSCGGKLVLRKGSEVGNIFDLGTKYSHAFEATYTAETGERKTVLMGCYGLGMTRLVGAIVEASHDEKGMIWPLSVAPFQVHLVSLRSKDEAVQSHINQTSQDVYDELLRVGVEVLWDDREGVSPGEKFADADLIGIPLRLVVSEKTLKENSVEWKLRKEPEASLVKVEDVTEDVQSWKKG